MTFGPFFHFFGHFTTLRARISGKHYKKVKIFAKFEFSVSDLPKKSKILPKKLFWPILIFLFSFLDSLTYGFRIIAQRFHIRPGRVGSHLIEHMLVHIRVTCVKQRTSLSNTIYSQSSNLSFFGGFSTLTPPGHLTPNYQNISTHTGKIAFLQFYAGPFKNCCDRARALVTSKSITLIFCFGRFLIELSQDRGKITVFCIKFKRRMMKFFAYAA